MVNHDLTGLLILCEIAAFEEATTARAVHIKLGWSDEFDDKRAHALGEAVGSTRNLALDQVDILDPSKWIFDLVTRGIVIDVVGDTGLLRRVEDDQVHLTLTDSAP